VDLVIVIGTSLKVAPVSEVVPFLPPNIPQIYISRTPVSHVNFDIDLLGDCDIVVSELCRRAGWDLDHEMVPEGQVIKVELAEGFASRHVFTQVHPAPPPPPQEEEEGEADAQVGGELGEVVKKAGSTRAERAQAKAEAREKMEAEAEALALAEAEAAAEGNEKADA